MAAILVAAGCHPLLADAAWITRERESSDPVGLLPIAVVTQHASALEVQLDDRGDAWLQFRVAPSDPALASSRCPTFQIDRRLPLLHFSIGDTCVVTAVSARLRLGHQEDSGILSPALYALVNGQRIAVRYITREGRYQEVIFPLHRSKRAVKQAVGGRRIRDR